MVCISGFSGTGKDEVAGVLTSKYKAIQTGLADPAKRHMADIYGFSEEQLFGPSHFRNHGDIRYPKSNNQLKKSKYNHNNVPYGLIGELKPESEYYSLPGRHKDDCPYFINENGQREYLIEAGDPEFWLSPREALQKYCELMNNLYLSTWSLNGIKTHKKLSVGNKFINNLWVRFRTYTKMDGVIELNNSIHLTLGVDHNITCFADFRHIHEIIDANKFDDESDSTVVLIRVKRPSVPTPPYDHRSEIEQTKIPDEAFDFILNNDGTLEDLKNNVVEIVSTFTKDNWTCSRNKNCVKL